jgi:hypothetical protein
MSRCDGRQKICRRGRHPGREDDAGENRVNAVWTDPRKFGRADFRRTSKLSGKEKAES